MTATALTHHEILRLVGPLAERGRHVDLAATDRAARVLRFRPVQHAGEPALRETLALHCDTPGRVRLLRTLTHAGGLVATFQVDAADVASALERLLAVEPASQFPLRGGVLVAESFVGGLRAPSRISGRRADGPALVCAEARVAGLTVRMEAPEGSVVGAGLRLLSQDGPRELPSDLLAVLGRAWRPLRPTQGGWKSSVRVSTRLATRSEELQQRFATTVSHLARVLSRPPSSFHARWRWRRWRVALRRLMPVLVSVALPLAVLGIVLWGSGQGVDWHPLAQFIPPLMLAAAFVWMSRELPVFELPPLPRPLPEDAWPAPPLGPG